MYELVIVGGGPAGLSTALHLERTAPRLAERTLLLERARYPRDKYCAGAVGGRGVRALEAIGVGVEVPSVRIDGFSVAMGEAAVSIREPGAAWVIRRDAFDAHLAAQLRTVELREGARVRRIERDAGGVTIVLDGDERIRARVLVGADGITGVVRGAIGLPRGALHAQAVEVDTPRVDGDPPADTIHFAFRRELHGYLWDFPTPLDGRVQMSRGAYLLRDRGDADPQAHLRRHLQRRRLDLDAHRVKQLAERGLEPGAPISAPRVILVGEAAGIDFPTGEGIAQAILHGQLAATYLADALAADRLDFSDWGTRWQLADEGSFLRRRLHGGRALFSAARPLVERALGRSPEVFRLVLRRFAGLPIERRLIAHAVAELCGQLLAQAPRAFFGSSLEAP